MKTIKNKRILNKIMPAIVTGMLMYQSASAQVIDAKTAIDQTQTQLRAITTSLITVVQIVMGIVAVVFIAINLVKYFKSPSHETNNDLMKIAIGIIIALILITVVKSVFSLG